MFDLVHSGVHALELTLSSFIHGENLNTRPGGVSVAENVHVKGLTNTGT